MEKAAAYVAWMMKTHKAYGIKCVNPAGVENWGWGKNVSSLDEANIHFEITPREIIKGLSEVNEHLGMPCLFTCMQTTWDILAVMQLLRILSRFGMDVKTRQDMDVEWAETKKDPSRDRSVYLSRI